MQDFALDELFVGSVTVGERGQVVIPAQARGEMAISPGDRLLVFRHPRRVGVMFVRVDAMQEFTTILKDSVARLEMRVAEADVDEDEPGERSRSKQRAKKGRSR